MKRFWSGIIAVTVLIAGIAANATEKELLLLSAPGADAKLASRVAQFCSTELNGLPVQLKSLNAVSDAAWPVVAKNIEGKMGKNDLAAVLLSHTGSSNLVMIASNKAVAVVDLTDPRKDGKADDELYARWIERETMLAYGLLLGLKICPNPQCAMSTYKVSPESLPMLGRNYCPYCRKILIEHLKAKGVEFPEAKRVKKSAPPVK